MADLWSDASSIVNASGFPFQEAVEHEVNRSRASGMHGWEILFSEYPWADQRRHEGFIDLGLQVGNARILIECKRVRQGKWIFLVGADSQDVERARLALHRPSWAYVATDEFRLTPSSQEARFCSIRGSGEDKPFFERIAGTLCRSLDAVAFEEYKRYGVSTDYSRCYLPIIVTNAELHLCRYQPDQVSLETGTVTGEAYETVEYLRFRKALDSTLDVAGKDLATVSKMRERTVFVVRASSLARFLQLLNIRDAIQTAGFTASLTVPPTP